MATEQFNQWLAGFSEGDGSLFKGDIRFEIWQSRADVKVLKYIMTQLGMGKIIYPAHRPDMAIYSITKDEELKVLKGILETRLCIARVNSRFNTIFKKENQLSLPSLENAYLSGLIDAEGCFWIRQEPKTNTFKFIFEISHKEEEILKNIKNLFSFNPLTRNIYPSFDCYKLCFYSNLVIKELMTYLSKYELQSHKNHVYLEWKRGLEIKTSGDPEKTAKLLEIQKNINKWRH